ncbi:isopentenyl-diphosphate Delta-isomerase [Salinisphaera sp. USBA-960]|nr:isopentenyl-diphosphate Delta-isomerase [Salifodinibacter halophilus]NNC27130.1 isopentenyl-diphosphate Delta-isomerase [Salifodinibacter halophilus]
MTESAPQISFTDEPLILVDSNDQPVGTMAKEEAHRGEGVLHRAFSIFIFNPAGEVLLQQRSADKALWGGYWANSCCSHPRRGEAMDAAVCRRQHEELGLDPEPTYLYRFEYHAQFGEAGAEHELCSVFVGCSNRTPAVNANEIEATAWLSPAALDEALASEPERYSPWLKLEWPRIRRDHWSTVEALITAAG